jgi:hypothetical protein
MQPRFTFSTYDEKDLLECGDRFVADLLAAARTFEANRFDNSTRVWTDLVLNWFANAAPSEPAPHAITVDTSKPFDVRLHRLAPALPHQFTTPRDGHGEALRVDQTHWRWPSYGGDRPAYWTKAYWKTALRRDEPLECVLALECEWAGKNADEHYAEVMHEAAKLLSLRARAKVVVFTTRSLDARAELLGDLRALRAKGGDAAPWLLVDLPWNNWPDDHRPMRRLFVDELRLGARTA